MHSLINRLGAYTGSATFKPADTFHWSPKKQVISYVPASLDNQSGQWALIHETAHAMLDHQRYQSDYQLLMIEIEAWQRAQMIATELGIVIDPEHIEDCLDTYRDWLHERSTCPACSSVSLQSDASTYNCHNCHTTWHVSTSRFCRPYRLRQLSAK